MPKVFMTLKFRSRVMNLTDFDEKTTAKMHFFNILINQKIEIFVINLEYD